MLPFRSDRNCFGYLLPASPQISRPALNAPVAAPGSAHDDLPRKDRLCDEASDKRECANPRQRKRGRKDVDEARPKIQRRGEYRCATGDAKHIRHENERREGLEAGPGLNVAL